MNRQEHLDWAKQRALEYVDANPPQLVNAFASLTSDLNKHEELKEALAIQTSLGMQHMIGNHLNHPDKMREWINGFN